MKGRESRLENALKGEERREEGYEGGVEGERGTVSHEEEKEECQKKEGGNGGLLSRL